MRLFFLVLRTCLLAYLGIAKFPLATVASSHKCLYYIRFRRLAAACLLCSWSHTMLRLLCTMFRCTVKRRRSSATIRFHRCDWCRLISSQNHANRSKIQIHDTLCTCICKQTWSIMSWIEHYSYIKRLVRSKWIFGKHNCTSLIYCIGIKCCDFMMYN